MFRVAIIAQLPIMSEVLHCTYFLKAGPIRFCSANEDELAPISTAGYATLRSEKTGKGGGTTNRNDPNTDG